MVYIIVQQHTLVPPARVKHATATPWFVQNIVRNGVQRTSRDGEPKQTRTPSCQFDLGHFESHAAMSAAGWSLDVDDAHFGSAFYGWKGGASVGSLRTRFVSSGVAALKFRNDHAADEQDNVVEARLGNRLLAQARALQEQLVCFQFMPDDELVISEVYGKIHVASFTVNCSSPAILSETKVLASRVDCGDLAHVTLLPALAVAGPVLPPLGGVGNYGEATATPRTGSVDAKQIANIGAASTGWCPFDLGNFQSRAVMNKAGWTVDVEDVSFGSEFVGWKGNLNVGSLRARFQSSGTAILIFRNDMEEIESKDNIVAVRLNTHLLAKAGALQEHFTCFQFRSGDEISISESYAKIRVRSLRLDCSLEEKLIDATAPPSGNISCQDDQQVWMAAPRQGCKQEQGSYPGVVELVLSETSLLARLYDFSPRGESVLKHVTMPSVILPGPPPGSLVNVRFSHCVDRKGVASIGVVVAADGQHSESYKEQIQTLYCYAAKQGYDMWLLDVRTFSACGRFAKFYFFQKHCAISEFLGQRPSGYKAVVVDGDVVAAVLERGLEQWTNVEADVQLYMRCTGHEIAAGNYIARNTPFARRFLMAWAERMYNTPKGYSSADNGALHLHVIETLGLRGAQTCADLYYHLVAEVTHLKPYYEFVHCTLNLLGPPRKWRISGGGSLLIWPKFHFFVADGYLFENHASSVAGPIFHHGYKARAWEPSAVHLTYYEDLGRCKLNVGRHWDAKRFGEKAAQHVPSELRQCTSKFECKTLGNEDSPVPSRTCGKCE